MESTRCIFAYNAHTHILARSHNHKLLHRATSSPATRRRDSGSPDVKRSRNWTRRMSPGSSSTSPCNMELPLECGSLRTSLASFRSEPSSSSLPVFRGIDACRAEFGTLSRCKAEPSHFEILPSVQSLLVCTTLILRVVFCSDDQFCRSCQYTRTRESKSLPLRVYSHCSTLQCHIYEGSVPISVPISAQGAAPIGYFPTSRPRCLRVATSRPRLGQPAARKIATAHRAQKLSRQRSPLNDGEENLPSCGLPVPTCE